MDILLEGILVVQQAGRVMEVVEAGAVVVVVRQNWNTNTNTHFHMILHCVSTLQCTWYIGIK